MTVSDMLTYASGKSNAGGSVWYGQVKATQVAAKSAFDAINNNQATPPQPRLRGRSFCDRSVREPWR